MIAQILRFVNQICGFYQSKNVETLTRFHIGLLNKFLLFS